jgi:hypothetical protein
MEGERLGVAAHEMGRVRSKSVGWLVFERRFLVLLCSEPSPGFTVIAMWRVIIEGAKAHGGEMTSQL